MKRGVEVLFVAALLWTGCDEVPVPKEHAYFRIDLPEQAYQRWQGECFSAEIPVYGAMRPHKSGERCWTDLECNGQKAKVHFTYKRIAGDLARLIEDSHDFKSKHQSKAARIKSDRVLRDSSRVFGTIFTVDGDVASPMVFYLTDSTDRFLYGSLYFNCHPNADSLAPVTQRMREDIRHLAATLEWE